MRSIVFVFLVLIGALLGAARASAQKAPVPASFDCARASDVIEQTICGDPKLAEADAVMARMFAAAKTSAFGKGPSNELAAQREWLKRRDTCRDFRRKTAYKSRADCLADSYDTRNRELAVAALFAEPKLALDNLRRLDPHMVPLYEAIFDYVSAPPRYRVELERLLRPYFTRFSSAEDWGSAKDLLDGINVPSDAIKSDNNFGSFLGVTSAYIDSHEPKTLPCAAMVRRPALIGAEASQFGSTMDNFVFNSDCADMLPPLPKLDALLSAINDTWPKCEGTIRFAAIRKFAMTVDAARLGDTPRRADDGLAPPEDGYLKRLPKSLVNDAIVELTRYYARYHRTAGHPARSLAVQNVREILSAGHSCGG